MEDMLVVLVVDNVVPTVVRLLPVSHVNIFNTNMADSKLNYSKITVHMANGPQCVLMMIIFVLSQLIGTG